MKAQSNRILGNNKNDDDDDKEEEDTTSTMMIMTQPRRTTTTTSTTTTLSSHPPRSTSSIICPVPELPSNVVLYNNLVLNQNSTYFIDTLQNLIATTPTLMDTNDTTMNNSNSLNNNTSSNDDMMDDHWMPVFHSDLFGVTLDGSRHPRGTINTLISQQELQVESIQLHSAIMEKEERAKNFTVFTTDDEMAAETTTTTTTTTAAATATSTTSEGWGNMFATIYNNKWKCKICADYNDNSKTACVVCQEPKPTGTTPLVV